MSSRKSSCVSVGTKSGIQTNDDGTTTQEGRQVRQSRTVSESSYGSMSQVKSELASFSSFPHLSFSSSVLTMSIIQQVFTLKSKSIALLIMILWFPRWWRMKVSSGNSEARTQIFQFWSKVLVSSYQILIPNQTTFHEHFTLCSVRWTRLFVRLFKTPIKVSAMQPLWLQRAKRSRWSRCWLWL